MIDNLITYLNDHAPSILQTLITLEVQIVLLGAIVFVADHFLKNASPKVRYSIWLIVLLKSFVAPFIELPMSSVRTITNISIPQISTPLPVSFIASTQPNAAIINTTPSLSLLSIILLVWMFISFVLIALSITRYVVLRWRLRSAEKIDPDSEIKLSESKNVFPDIFKTHKIQTPFAFGFFKPKIFITSSLVHSDVQKLKSVLYHELAHIKRKDGLMTLIQTISQIIHPFNPVMWFTNIRLYNYREQICDQYAIEHTSTEPQAYGEMLLSYMENNNSNYSHLKPVTCFFETKKGLTQRIKNILNHKEAYMRRFSFMHFILLGGIFLCLIMTSWNCKKSSPPAGRSYLSIDDVQKISAFDVPPELINKNDPTNTIFNNFYHATHDNKSELNEEFLFKVNIDESGKVTSVKAITGFNNTFIKPLIDGVSNSQWKPAKMNGRSIACEIQLPIQISNTTNAGVEQNPSNPSFDVAPEIIGGIAALQKQLYYPETALKAGIEGTVTLKVMILENGWVDKTIIVSSPDSSLSRAAIRAVRSVTWKPAYKNGKALTWAEIKFPVKFIIASSDKFTSSSKE